MCNFEHLSLLTSFILKTNATKALDMSMTNRRQFSKVFMGNFMPFASLSLFVAVQRLNECRTITHFHFNKR